MPWTAASGTTYRLCLLDTNAISEIVKYPKVEGDVFLKKFLIDKDTWERLLSVLDILVSA